MLNLSQSPGEIRKREVSWTLKLALRDQEQGGGAGLESWTSFASLVSQRWSYGHCDSVPRSSWDSNCVVRWSLRNAGRTLP